MLVPELAAYTPLSLLLLRIMIALVFGTSGWSHLTKPKERGESIGMSPAATSVLGAVELASAIALVLGVFVQVAAVLLIGVMLGAIGKKMFVWKSGFWGSKNDGWYYDLLYLVCNVVLLATGGGDWTLL
ncbi:MAG TPA: DoxX family protein [Gemmatimonadaceae bacterium]|nr:DoxX family protein [Gemmatimonadaceae bacterium]